MSESSPPPATTDKEVKYPKLNDVWNFCAVHKAFFVLAFAWMVRELATCHGLVGAWHFILNGSTQ